MHRACTPCPKRHRGGPPLESLPPRLPPPIARARRPARLPTAPRTATPPRAQSILLRAPSAPSLHQTPMPKVLHRHLLAALHAETRASPGPVAAAAAAAARPARVHQSGCRRVALRGGRWRRLARTNRHASTAAPRGTTRSTDIGPGTRTTIRTALIATSLKAAGTAGPRGRPLMLRGCTARRCFRQTPAPMSPKVHPWSH